MKYLNIAVKELNVINKTDHLDFIVVTGDFGIEKLIKKYPLEEFKAQQHIGQIIETNGQFFELKKDEKLWAQAVQEVADVIQQSDVNLWLILPENNDLYDELPDTINFYADFVHAVKEAVKAQNEAIDVVDFRLESNDQIANFEPGTLKIHDHFFIGWNNAFFKNNYSVTRFLDSDNNLKPIDQLEEYQSLEKLADTIDHADAKSVYIFFHIPEIDDPWRVNFSIDPKNLQENIVTKMIKEA